MIINQSLLTQQNKSVSNKEKGEGGKNISPAPEDKKMPAVDEKPDFMQMSSVVSDWKNKADELAHPPGLGFEVASLIGGVALGFKLFCVMEGNPVGLLAGLAVGGAVATLKNRHDIKKSKELKEEVESKKELVVSYEKALNEEEIRQANIRAEQEKKKQDEILKQQELQKAEELKKHEEIKKKEEEFNNILKEDLENFKKKNNILFETGIISSKGWYFEACESRYSLGDGDIIDVNEDGEANTTERHVASFRKETHYKEPALTVPYEQIERTAREMKKGIVTRDEIKNMGAKSFGISVGTFGPQPDYEIDGEEKSLDLIAKNLMPDVPGVRGAIDILNKRFVIYKPKDLPDYSV